MSVRNGDFEIPQAGKLKRDSESGLGIGRDLCAVDLRHPGKSTFGDTEFHHPCRTESLGLMLLGSATAA
jgi:hypothetical protein